LQPDFFSAPLCSHNSAVLGPAFPQGQSASGSAREKSLRLGQKDVPAVFRIAFEIR
jgi:hypothetical protein